jgi:hypothetical protein
MRTTPLTLTHRTKMIAAGLTTALAMLTAAPAAHAGRACEEATQSIDQIVQGMNLAQATRVKLDASGADVVLLARAGQDLSRWGLQWSHMGIAYKEAQPTTTATATTDGKSPSSVWRVVHLLNHCGTSHSALYRQGLGEFFLDNPHRYQSAFVVLKPELQKAMKPLLTNDFKLRQWHNASYNMVAYPWSTQNQQSNQWALELMAMGSQPSLRTRQEAQMWLQHKGYRPTVLRIDTMQRLGARMGSANISFDDHPNHKRFSGHIETITVDSVFSWLRVTGQSDSEVIVR